MERAQTCETRRWALGVALASEVRAETDRPMAAESQTTSGLGLDASRLIEKTLMVSGTAIAHRAGACKIGLASRDRHAVRE